MRTTLRTGAIVLAATSWVLAQSAGGPQSGPATPAERVGFPRDYLTGLPLLRRDYKPAKGQVIAVYANEPAAAVSELNQLPYPDGAVFVFEWANRAVDAAGQPVAGPVGGWQRGEVTRIDVMRRAAGFGAVYGADRAGEWEFASFRPDGTSMAEAPELRECARCHRRAAERDFVFRGKFPPLATK